MSRFLSDQNKVVILMESGTYGAGLSTGSRWPGQVQEFSLDEQQGKIETRYLGNASRSFAEFNDGPIDVTATLTTNPQDFLLFGYAIGSVSESNTGSSKLISVSEVNSNVIQNPFVSGTNICATLPFSFTIEDSKQSPGAGRNFIRTVKGAVIDTANLTLTQGEKASIEYNLVGQSVVKSSGTTTSITARNVRPFLWDSATLTSFGVGANTGSDLSTAKEISLEVSNNIEPPHYVNGSRVIAEPFMKNRDYTLNVTADLNANTADMIYNQFWQGGSTFNTTLDLNQDKTTGSQHAIFIMSGCEVTSFEAPSPLEGVNEVTLEIRPKNLSATFYDHVNAGSYNPY